MTYFTRTDYMSSPVHAQGTEEERAAAHRRYYAQFVTPSIKHLVMSRIGVDRIKASTHPHMSDIPLKEWDNLDSAIRPTGASIHKKINGVCAWSLSDTVCVAKEAAKQIKESD